MGMTVLRKGGSTPVASDDRILFDKIFDAAGIITGGGATMSAVNKIHVPETTAWIKGTEIKIDEQDVTVGLSDSGTKYGRVLLVLDWSTEETAHFEYEVAASTSAFQELTQEDDINFSGGTWEEVFATYTCTEASISDVAFCMSMLQDANGGALIAGSESGTLSTQQYVAGQYLIWNGKLKKATAAIAIGDTLAVGTNLSADTTVGNELYALNSSLDNIDIRYTSANGAEWSPRGAGTWSPFNSVFSDWVQHVPCNTQTSLEPGKYLLMVCGYNVDINSLSFTGATIEKILSSAIHGTGYTALSFQLAVLNVTGNITIGGAAVYHKPYLFKLHNGVDISQAVSEGVAGTITVDNNGIYLIAHNGYAGVISTDAKILYTVSDPMGGYSSESYYIHVVKAPSSGQMTVSPAPNVVCKIQ